ncbi:hypothetical protein CKO51_20800 [Rhodopirellula sp. SM50]|nr:TIR domain-containing protein [Rhodopirellula sp. SM50]PAY17506.1 hypothetical protein CKO51_20800 [Rhodopirellula sp. SM50]
MTENAILCPNCGSADIRFRKKRNDWFCDDCDHRWQGPPPNELNPRRTRLFLSYGRHDAAALADRLTNDLTEAGFDVWRDEEQIRTGAAWEKAIRDGLHSTQIMIAVLTPHAVRLASDSDHPDEIDGVCLDEISFARFGRPPKPIVPVMAIPCETPFSIFRLDYVDLTRWQESEDHYKEGFQRLLNGIHSAERNETRYRDWASFLRPWDFAAFLYEKRRDFVGREWLFDEIDQWRVNNHDERALLITGDPGTGKSSIVAELVHRNPDSQVLAFHCCQWDTPETLAPWRFVSSVASMLASRLPEYAEQLNQPSVREALTEASCRHDPASAFEQGVLAPLETLHVPANGPRYLLIDSLDEALELGSRQNIVQLIASRLGRLPGWVRIVATTRNDAEVLTKLSGLRARELDARDSRNVDDVRAFLEVKMASFDSPNAVEVLLERSDGNFRYVRFAVAGIESGRYDIDKLGDLPPGLYGLYAEAFERLFPDGSDFNDAYRVLSVIIAAQTPLTSDEISEATGFDSKRIVPAVLRKLSQYLTTRRKEDQKNHYAIFHKSFADWLTAPSLLGSEFSVLPEDGQSCLADWCMGQFKKNSGEMPDYCRRFVVVHLLQLERWGELSRVLTNLAYLESRVLQGELIELVSEFATAVASIQDDHPAWETLSLLHRAIRRDMHFIERHAKDYPQALFQCVWNTGWWYGNPESEKCYGASRPHLSPTRDSTDQAVQRVRVSPLSKLLEEWRKERETRRGKFVWLRSLRPPTLSLDSPLESVLIAEGALKNVAWSPDGSLVAGGGSPKGTISVWNPSTGTLLISFECHTANITSVEFSPNGKLLASASLDSTIRVFNTSDWSEVICFRACCEGVTDLAWTPNSEQLVASAADGCIRRWSLIGDENRLLAKIDEDWAWSVAVHPSGNVVASGTESGRVVLCDLDSGRVIRTFDSKSTSVWSVAFSPDGELVSAASQSPSIRQWKVRTGQETAGFFGHENFAREVAYSPDGSKLASVSFDRTARVWEVSTGSEIASFPEHEQWVECLAWSPDGSRVATGSRHIRIQRVDTRHGHRSINDHFGRIVCVAVAHDESLIATGAADGICRIWDAKTGLELDRTPMRPSWVERIGFLSPPNKMHVKFTDGWAATWNLAKSQFQSEEYGPSYPGIPAEQIVVDSEMQSENDWYFPSGKFVVKQERSEARIIDSDSLQPVAWWPLRFDCTGLGTTTTLLAGSSGHRLIALRLEGSEES